MTTKGNMWRKRQWEELARARERMRKLDEAVATHDPEIIRRALEDYEREIGNGEGKEK